MIEKDNPESIKEITTTEIKKKGIWTKIIQIKYIKQLLCPEFLDTKILMILASAPLLLFIGIIIWRIFNYE